jgi:hypothetical protein
VGNASLNGWGNIQAGEIMSLTENEENSQLSNLNAARTDKEKADEMKVA